jgi:hypothetical protein
MRQRAVLIASVCALSACYFSPDKHREEEASEAGTANDGSTLVSMDAATADALAADASDAKVDAGCTSDQQCPSAAPHCLGGACLPCNAASDCARFPATPACGPKGACVACTSDHKQLCTGATPACETATNSCVACTADSDCQSETKASCQSDHTCGLCTEDADCARFGKVCNARNGACVQCRPESEETDCRNDKSCDAKTADCAGTACDPTKLTCTNKQRGTVPTCTACVADSECVTDHRCIPMTYGGDGSQEQLGGFCLKRSAVTCAKPFTTLVSRPSASGAPIDEYCTIDETLTTCDAVLLFDKAKLCDSDASCGTKGAICSSIKPLPQACTYKCGSNFQCYDGYQCGADATGKHCGG